MVEPDRYRRVIGEATIRENHTLGFGDGRVPMAILVVFALVVGVLSALVGAPIRAATAAVSGGAPALTAGPRLAATTDGAGYWIVGPGGVLVAYGDAPALGSTAGDVLDAPIVGIAATPNGRGYWLVASDGGVFAYGDAQFYGSMGGRKLDAAIVGITSTPDGGGYWLVASDGGVFAFGDAVFAGSMAGKSLNAPIVDITGAPSGKGYWLVGSDGGVFTFDTGFFGSAGSLMLSRPIVGIAATHDGGGYWLVASDGGVFAYGDARFGGSAVGVGSAAIGLIANGTGTGYEVISTNGAPLTLSAGLTVINTVNDATPANGQDITYTVVVTDAGPSNANGVVVSDPLPPGLSFVDAAGPAGTTYNPTTGVWTVGTLAAGSSDTLTITAVVSGASTLTDTATASASDATTVSSTALVDPSDLTLVKTDDDGGSSVTDTIGTATAGATITYSIVVSNSGSAPATPTLTDVLPSAITADSWVAAFSGGASATADSGTGNVADDLSVQPGATATYTIAATISSSAIGSMSNTATLAQSSAPTLTATDTDTLTSAGDLTVTNTVNDAMPANSQDITYTVVVTDNGLSDATGVGVSDPLPSGLSFISSTSSAGTSYNSGTGAWTVGSLAAGSSDTLSITAQVSGASTLTDTATASASDATAVSSTAVVNPSDLTLVKTDNDGGSSVTDTMGTAVPGTSITYTIVVSNSGSGAAMPTLTDLLTSSITSDSWETSFTGGASANVDSGTGIIDGDLSLPAGATATYTIAGTISSSAIGSMSNTATLAQPSAPTLTAIDTDTLS